VTKKSKQEGSVGSGQQNRSNSAKSLTGGGA